MSSLLRSIREDAQYKQYMKIRERAFLKLDLEQLHNEAMGLHAARTSRQLYGNRQFSGKAVMEAELKDLTSRARLVEIRVKVAVAVSTLNEAIKAVKRYISTEYADDLSEFSSATQRTAFVERVLKSGLQDVAEAQSLISVIDILVKDIDQAGFTLHNATEVLKLLSNVKGKII